MKREGMMTRTITAVFSRSTRMSNTKLNRSAPSQCINIFWLHPAMMHIHTFEMIQNKIDVV
jgi:hypothetical protein